MSLLNFASLFIFINFSILTIKSRISASSSHSWIGNCSLICEGYKCISGCQKSISLSKVPCENICGEKVESLGHFDSDSCLEGCLAYRYEICNITKSLVSPLPVPHPRASSITNDSVIIEWKSTENRNLTYFIQYQYVSKDHDRWTFHNVRKIARNNSTQVEGLRPFTDYRFRLVYQPMLDCEPIISEPSVVIRTNPSGVATNPPEITSLQPLGPHEITLTWKAPEFPNDHIIAYILYLYEYDINDISVKPISTHHFTHEHTHLHSSFPYPANRTFRYEYNQSTPLQYTFSNLKSKTLYTVGISILNSFGHGPLAIRNVTTLSERATDMTTSPATIYKQGYPIKDIEDEVETAAYLLIASERVISRYSTDLIESFNLVDVSTRFIGDPQLTEPPEIKAIDVHIKRNLLLVSDSFGKIWHVDLSLPSNDVDYEVGADLSGLSRKVFPLKVHNVDQKSLNVRKLAIDWVNDYVYLLTSQGIGRFKLHTDNLDRRSHQFEWFLNGLDTNRTSHIHVDPIGNYIYWSLVGPKDGGLYRTSLTLSDKPQLQAYGQKLAGISRLLIRANLTVFTIDSAKQKIYFPENSTIYSFAIDNYPYANFNNLTNVRPNVVANSFHDVDDLAHFAGKFFWFSGFELYHEEFLDGQSEIHHNSNTMDDKLIALVVVHPLLQPYPSISSHFHEPNMARIGGNQQDLATFLWTFTGSLAFLSVLLFLARKVMKDKSSEKEALKDPERGNESNLISLTQLPGHPHEDNRLYLPGELSLECDFSRIPLIAREQIEVIRNLGSGAFGQVQEGWGYNLLHDQPNRRVKIAVKTLRESFTEKDRKSFIKEAKMMANFRHPHILQLLGVCLDPEWNAIILELMEGGALRTFLQTKRSKGEKPAEMTIDDLLRICIDVAKGCQYLEEMHFVHRDLAARNCLVSSEDPKSCIVKIGDFGLTRDIYQDAYYRKEGEALLPVRWMAPESLIDAKFTTQSDVWSFGVLLWEVMTFGELPYAARGNEEVYYFVREGGHPERPANCIEEMYILMKKCWHQDFRKRPTFLMCLNYLETLRNKISSSYTVITSISNDSYFTDDVGGFENPGYETNTEERLTELPSTEGETQSKIVSLVDSGFSCSSRCDSVTSKYLKMVSINPTTDRDGYEIPIASRGVSMYSNDSGNPRFSLDLKFLENSNSGGKSAENDAISSSPSPSTAYFIDGNHETILRHKSVNGSPPPTYSQLFSGSSSISNTPLEVSSLSSSPLSSHSFDDQLSSSSSPLRLASKERSDSLVSTDINSDLGELDKMKENFTRPGSPDSIEDAHEMPSVTAALLKTPQTTTNLYRNISQYCYES